jgi:hypothetical protein
MLLWAGTRDAHAGCGRTGVVSTVVHRIDNPQPEASEVSFSGLLDAEALTSLAAMVAQRWSTGSVRLVLRAGTEVVPDCIPGLLALDFTVTAESPYLARWLHSARAGERAPSPATIETGCDEHPGSRPGGTK